MYLLQNCYFILFSQSEWKENYCFPSEKCATDQQTLPWYERQTMCPHTNEERILRGVWCTNELQKAVQLGYKIVKIPEVWNFSEDQRVKGLFADYVNTWLKIKRKSAGWPERCVIEEQKAKYIQTGEKKEGIS